MIAITREAANVLGQLDSLGTIKTGKIGNFTVLEQNPLKVEPHLIKDINVLDTIYRGSELKRTKFKL